MKLNLKPFYIIREIPILLLLRILTLMIVSDTIFFIFDLVFDLNETNGSIIPTLSTTEEFFLGIIILQLLIMIYLFAEWMANLYWFQDKILHHKRGIIWINHEEFILAEIESAHFRKNLLGRLFNYGAISISFPNQKVILKHIPRPDVFIKMMTEEIQIAHNNPSH